MYSVQKVLDDLTGKDLQSGPLVTVLSRRMYGDGLIVELGTGKGETTRLISSSIGSRTLYTFDSFLGNPEPWRQGYGAGHGGQGGQPPRVDSNVVIGVGMFADTLPAFAAAHSGERIALLYVDCDLYSSTKTALNALKPLIGGGTTVVFDEFLNHPDFQNHEIKAFVEYLNESGAQYEVLGMRGSPVQFGQAGWDNWQFEKAAFYLFKAGEPHVIPVSAPFVPLAASSSSGPSYTTQLTRPVSHSFSLGPSASSSLVANPIRYSPSMSNLASSSTTASLGRKAIRAVLIFGRRQYFACLLQYVLRELDVFDEVIIWKNTAVADDITYLDNALGALKAQGLDSKFRVIHPAKVTGRADGVFPLYAQLNDPYSLYVKLDDDIVWVAPGSFRALTNYALANEHKYCVFSANVVNSGRCDAIHQAQGASALKPYIFPMDNPYANLMKPKGALQVHSSLQKAIDEQDISKYNMEHVYLNGVRWSINAIAFFGNLFNSKDCAQLALDDERYITKSLAKIKGKDMVVVPGTLMSHYAFGPQRNYRSKKASNIVRLQTKKTFDADGAILAKYAQWAGVPSPNSSTS